MAEKLVLSIEDLGRLAQFMEGKPDSPLDLLKQWIALYSENEEQAKAMCVKLHEGYEEEHDLIHGEGPLKTSVPWCKSHEGRTLCLSRKVFKRLR